MRTLIEIHHQYERIVTREGLSRKIRRALLCILMDEMNVYYGLYEDRDESWKKRNSKALNLYRKIANSR